MIREKLYEVLRRPVQTEKTTAQEADGIHCFVVAAWATKQDVSAALQALYQVKVERVNMLNRKGKTKMRGRTKGRRKDLKMAFVRLAKDETLDLAKAVQDVELRENHD